MGDVFIKVDISKIAREVTAKLPSKDDQNRMVQGLGAAAMAFWKKQAMEHLTSSSREYVQGLTSESEDRKFTITLSGALSNMIEQGFAGGDMRKWMLNGPKARRSKRGSRYLIIPFQHGTPGTSGRNVGHEMPASIHEAASKLAPTLSRPARGAGGGTTTRYGGRLTENSANLSHEAHRLLTTKQKPWHQSSVYRGMIRQAKTFKKTTQTTGYNTFRVISDAVTRGARGENGEALQHWAHPGITARKFAEKTQKHVAKIAATMLGHATREKR